MCIRCVCIRCVCLCLSVSVCQGVGETIMARWSCMSYPISIHEIENTGTLLHFLGGRYVKIYVEFKKGTFVDPGEST